MRRKMARTAMPEEQRARLREVDRLRNARGLRAEGSLTQDEEDTHDILTNIAIQRARAAALEYLHRTQVEGNDDSVHQAHVCVVCDETPSRSSAREDRSSCALLVASAEGCRSKSESL